MNRSGSEAKVLQMCLQPIVDVAVIALHCRVLGRPVHHHEPAIGPRMGSA